MKIFLSYDLNGEGHQDIKNKMIANGYRKFDYDANGKKVLLPDTVLIWQIDDAVLKAGKATLQKVEETLREAIKSYNEEKTENTTLSSYFIADCSISLADGEEPLMKLNRNK